MIIIRCFIWTEQFLQFHLPALMGDKWGHCYHSHVCLLDIKLNSRPNVRLEAWGNRDKVIRKLCGWPFPKPISLTISQMTMLKGLVVTNPRKMSALRSILANFLTLLTAHNFAISVALATLTTIINPVFSNRQLFSIKSFCFILQTEKVRDQLVNIATKKADDFIRNGVMETKNRVKGKLYFIKRPEG